MNINLHIERLILDAVPVARHQVPMIEAALQSELARLLSQSNALPEPRGGATPMVRAPGFQLERRVIPHNLGRQIAESVYASISR